MRTLGGAGVLPVVSFWSRDICVLSCVCLWISESGDELRFLEARREHTRVAAVGELAERLAVDGLGLVENLVGELEHADGVRSAFFDRDQIDRVLLAALQLEEL